MPRAFKFSLEAALSFRKLKEEAALREFAIVRRLCEERRQALNRLFDTRDLALTSLGERSEGKLVVLDLLRYQRYLNGLRVQITSAQAELAKFEEELAARQNLLAEAMKDRKVIENLKERRYNEWLVEYRRSEQRETDEIGAQIVRRKSQDGIL